jgi:hypothetical protein
MMEQSSKFISLSGLSGVMAGLTALAGAFYGHFLIRSQQESLHQGLQLNYDGIRETILTKLFIAAALTLIVAIGFGAFFTIRKAKAKGQSIFGSTSRRLAVNMLIPLVSGGLFCLVLIYHGLIGLVAPATLIFYGLALVNASKYTLNDIRNLGILEIILGLIASIYIGYGTLFWAIGFGVLHIIYGIVMYFKYDKA